MLVVEVRRVSRCIQQRRRRGRIFKLTETGAESNSGEAIGGITRRRVCAVRIVEGLEGSCVAEPEGAEGAEDNEGERVADDELGLLGTRTLRIDHTARHTSPTDPRIMRRPPKK
jgi:hypothetical protein